MGVGLDIYGIGFPRWRSKSSRLSYACYETTCHDDSGQQSCRCYHYDNSKYPFSSPLSLFFDIGELQYYCLSPTHSGVYLCIRRVNYLSYKTPRVSFFILRDFLILYFISFLWFFDPQIILGRSQPSGVRFRSSSLIALAPSDWNAISVIFTDPTEKIVFFLSLPLYLSVFVFPFMWSTHSLLYIASSSSLHCLGGFSFSFRAEYLTAGDGMGVHSHLASLET